MVVRVAVGFLMFFACTLMAPPPVARAAGCDEIISQRNRMFDANKNLLTEISKLRKAISAEEAQLDILSGGAQENVKNDLARDTAALKIIKPKQQEAAQKLKELDAEVAKCRQKSPESVGGSWAGKWRGGNRDYQVFVLLGRVNYNETSPDKSITGQGSCSVIGSTATCDYEERYRLGSEEMDSFGKQELTFNGDTILEKRTLTSVECYNGGQALCAAARAHIGQPVEDTWHRVKP